MQFRRVIKPAEMDGVVGRAEVHWYECHVGRVKMKVKLWL